MSDAPEYSAHDFSAVNRHVNEVVNRNMVITSSRRAGVFATYAKYGAILIVALGIAGLLLLWGAARLLNPKPEVITKEVVVEKPVSINPNIYLTTPTGSSQNLKTLNEAAQAKKSKLEAGVASSPGSDRSPVFNYVIFKNVPFGKYGLKEVTVGMRYPDNDAEDPQEQWCYITKEVGAGVDNRFSLALKRNQKRIDLPIDADTSQQLGVPVSALREAQALCAFE